MIRQLFLYKKVVYSCTALCPCSWNKYSNPHFILLSFELKKAHDDYTLFHAILSIIQGMLLAKYSYVSEDVR
jgi:hypothetical protein